MSTHVGLKTRIQNIIHSIKADSGKKYDRYFCIAYLPKTDKLSSCLAMGCLEIEKEGEREFFNPSKFYDIHILDEAIIHILCSYMAFKALKTSRPLPSIIHSTLSNIYGNQELRAKIAELAQRYLNIMLNAERGQNQLLNEDGT